MDVRSCTMVSLPNRDQYGFLGSVADVLDAEEGDTMPGTQPATSTFRRLTAATRLAARRLDAYTLDVTNPVRHYAMRDRNFRR